MGFREDVAEALTEAKSWIGEIENRVQPAFDEVEKYADPFIQTLAAGLASAGITVPVKYVDVALSLVSKLAALDPADTSAPVSDPPAAPAVPAVPAAADDSQPADAQVPAAS